MPTVLATKGRGFRRLTFPLGLRPDVTQPLPARPITTQYREDDFNFLVRLLADAGLAWHFEAEEARPRHTAG